MIAIAKTDDEIQNCYAVMAELRPHIQPAEFLSRVKRQIERANFKLVYLLLGGEVKAIGGIRISEWLAGGKYLEIEDLVTKSGERSNGSGGKLFDWIIEYAKENDCEQVKLVSNVKRFGAHKFYLNKGMIIEAHYFSMQLK